MRKIKLTQGKVAIVDDEDFKWLNQNKWCFHYGYATRRNGERITRMHQFILKCPQGKEIDHINHNGLDNRKKNLRICSHQENLLNRKRSNTTSGYPGVSWHRHAKLWRVQTSLNNHRIHIGYFKNEKKAAEIYKKIRKSLIKRFYPNFSI